MTGRETTDEQDDTLDKPETDEPTHRKSMHEGVPVWYDCCSCEAEPYWIEAMDED